MADAFSLLENAVLSFSLSVALAALVWAFMARMKQEGEDPRELFFGTLYGALKVSVLYLVLVPAVKFAGLSGESAQFLSVLLVELSILLAIQLFSYVFTHLIQAHKEALALGIIGGITRSEAVSGSMAALVRDDPALLDTAVVVILAANTTMLLRTLFLLLLIPGVGSQLFFDVLPAVLGMFAVAVAILYYTYKKGNVADIKLRPISFSMAVQIVLAFAVISALSAFAGSFGNYGYYLIAALGALAGALPVVLSVIALIAYKSVEAQVAANMVIIAVVIGYVNDSLVALLFKQKELFSKLAGRYAFVLGGGLAGFLLGRGLLDLSGLPKYSFLLFFLLVFIPVFVWLSLKKRDPALAASMAWGLFGALANIVVLLLAVPLLPQSFMGVDVRKLLYLLAGIVLLEILLFLYTRLRTVSDLTSLGFVAGIASAESLTFTLSRHAPEPAGKVVFAAKSSMYLRNLAVLFALSTPLALKLAPLLVSLSLVFLVLSAGIRTDEQLQVKPSSIGSVLLLFLLLLAAGFLSKLSFDYLGVYGLFASILAVSFTGFLPPMLSVVALLLMGSIGQSAAVLLLSLSALLVSMNDALIARIFRAKEFSAFLLRRAVAAFVVGAVVFYFAYLRG